MQFAGENQAMSSQQIVKNNMAVQNNYKTSVAEFSGVSGVMGDSIAERSIKWQQAKERKNIAAQ
jgi:hypothetical protein